MNLYLGGSTRTIARGSSPSGCYKLYGHKWFSSAADAEMAFTLARIVDKEGLVTEVGFVSCSYICFLATDMTSCGRDLDHAKCAWSDMYIGWFDSFSH